MQERNYKISVVHSLYLKWPLEAMYCNFGKLEGRLMGQKLFFITKFEQVHL